MQLFLYLFDSQFFFLAHVGPLSHLDLSTDLFAIRVLLSLDSGTLSVVLILLVEEFFPLVSVFVIVLYKCDIGCRKVTATARGARPV